MGDSPTTLFPVTPATLLAEARPVPGEDAGAADARWRQRLSELCALYRGPIVAWFASVGGQGDPGDLAHDFLCRWLSSNPLAAFEAGDRRFRPFLKASLRNFLVESHRKAARAKRGGGVEHVDVQDAGLASPEPGASELVDRLLAHETCLRVLRTLERGWPASPGPVRVELLRRIVDRQGMGDAALAAGLGISINALRLRVSRLRQQFWARYYDEVQAQCRGAVAAEEEFATLVQVMQRDPALIDSLDAVLRDGWAS